MLEVSARNVKTKKVNIKASTTKQNNAGRELDRRINLAYQLAYARVAFPNLETKIWKNLIKTYKEVHKYTTSRNELSIQGNKIL